MKATEQYFIVLMFTIYVVQDVSTTFRVCESKLLRGTFLWCCLLDIKRFFFVLLAT